MFSEVYDYKRLSSKLQELQTQYDIMTCIIQSDYEEWEKAFELIEEIQEAFKSVRYPVKSDRDIAWQGFYSLRNNCYEERRKDFKKRSDKYYDEFWDLLKDLYYSSLIDTLSGIVSFGELSMTKEKMREMGRELNDVAKQFSDVKNEMIGEHKAKIHEKIVEVRESHDVFWKAVKDRESELQEIREEKKRDWEERQERKKAAKKRIEENLQKNKEKLEKAEEALSRFETTQSNLEDKIAGAYSESFREKHEEWLDEINEKINSVKEQIERLEGWIREDEEKLENWDD
ncbi:MAG: hypothetical protein JWO92_3 [Chitinophagaceae bacterium]|nr:hypothetical protein [Chitinophagaceae bacterium]